MPLNGKHILAKKERERQQNILDQLFNDSL